MKGFIYSQQDSLFGHRDVIGFGEDNFHVKIIDRNMANEIIVKNHYSNKFYAASIYHFGLFNQNQLVGVLQFGYAMNPASYASVVEGTKENEYLELNRMWICDSQPRNTESKTISYCIKALKKLHPNLAWVQSFADERCGKFGVVYQACNFDYCGEHSSTFWELDGVFYHNIIMTAKRGKAGSMGKILQENASRAIRHDFRQFRYIYFIKKSFRKNLLHQIKPYPKPEMEPPLVAKQETFDV